jgi:hypothetical protein
LRERRVTIDIKKQPEAELCGLLDPAYRPGAAHPDTHVLLARSALFLAC